MTEGASTKSVNERWSDCYGYAGVYEVSSLGRVRRIGKARSARVGRILTPALHKSGYEVVNLWRNNKGKVHSVHRLVAMAFVPGDHSLSVNHIDGDKRNNTPSNLEWVTLAENTRHQWDTGLANSSGCYRPEKVSLEQRKEIRRRALAGERQKDIASDYGCSQSLISWIVHQHCQQVMA